MVPRGRWSLSMLPDKGGRWTVKIQHYCEPEPEPEPELELEPEAPRLTIGNIVAPLGDLDASERSATHAHERGTTLDGSRGFCRRRPTAGARKFYDLGPTMHAQNGTIARTLLRPIPSTHTILYCLQVHLSIFIRR